MVFAQVEVAAGAKVTLHTFASGVGDIYYRYAVNVIMRNSGDNSSACRLGWGSGADTAGILPNSKWFAEFTLLPHDSGEQSALTPVQGDILFVHNLSNTNSMVFTVQGLREAGAA